MEDILIPIVVFVSMVTGIILFTKILADYKLRKRLIEKGHVDEKASNILNNESNLTNKYSSLKWGLVVLFGGIGLIVINLMPYDGEEPLPYGIFAVSVAIGFLSYFFYVKRETENK